MTEKTNRVAVVGAGTMGPGIAATFAVHGYDTRLMDTDPEALERAKGTVETVYQVLCDAGLMDQEQVATGRSSLEFMGDLSTAVDNVDLVVETIPERLEIKQSFVADVEPMLDDETIIASNTSGIPITKLAENARRPERIVGMHWSNPPHIIPVVEVIKGERTTDETVDEIWQVTEDLEMVPVLVRRDVMGFVENRVLYAIMRECLHLLDEGIASAEDIDTVVKWGIGYKLAVIGPMELLDVAGLDIYDSVASYLNADLSNEAGVSRFVKEKVEKGELGIKTGAGLFSYSPDEIGPLMQRRMQRLLETKKVLADWINE